MDLQRLAVLTDTFLTAHLPPLVSVLQNNIEELRDMTFFSKVNAALIKDSLIKWEELLDINGIEEEEDRRDHILFGSSIIVKTLNSAYDLDFPNILAIFLMQEDEGVDKFSLSVRSFKKSDLPGMHDCLRSDIVPTVIAKPKADDENDFDITSVDIYPKVTDQEEFPTTE